LEAKVRDIVALYRNPPDTAVALYTDDRASLQTPDQAQPRPPDCLSVPAHHSDDNANQHDCHINLPAFLRQIAIAYPRVKLHIICNSPANQYTSVAAWLACNPHIIFHFTPTTTWHKLFAVLTITCRTANHGSLAWLSDTAANFINNNNPHHQPYIWIKRQLA
jgi:hypothetical protein